MLDRKPLTDFGVSVVSELAAKGKTQAWLINEIKKNTDMYIDRSNLNKVLTGQIKNSKITELITAVLF